MKTQGIIALKFRKVLAFVLCFGLIFSTNGFIFESKVYAEKTFTISPSYSSADTLASKLITITASEAAFSAGSAYPRIYKSGTIQDVTITNLESTSTQVRFKIASALQNGQTYTIGIDGPVGYSYGDVGQITVNSPSISGEAPLVSILKGYNSQKSIAISGLYTNFSQGQTNVELLQNDTVRATGTVTDVTNNDTNDGQQLTFSINTGLSSGDYDLRITTGSEIVLKAAAIKVLGTQTIVLSQTSLSSSYSNGTTITATGTNTLFNSDVTSVSILDADGNNTEMAGTGVVNSNTSMTFPVSSGLDPGIYTVQILTTGTSESAPTATLTVSQPTGVLKKNSVAVTTLGSNYPNLSLTIEGSNTSFQSGTTQLFVFEQGVEIEIEDKISGSPSISGQTITFTLAGGVAALEPGDYEFRAVTGSQTAVIPFSVVQPEIDLVYNSSIVDASGVNTVIALGYKTFSIDITGTNTHFTNSTTVAVDGVGVQVSYTSETQISFNMPEDKLTGQYDIEIDMDGDEGTAGDILTENFEVGAEAVIESVSPGTVINIGDVTTVTVIGSNTHFTAGTPLVDIIGASETIENITVIDDTTLTFELSSASLSTGLFAIQTSITNGVIEETAVSGDILTVTNSGFINIKPIVYTLDMYSTTVTLEGKNLAETISEEIAVTVGGYNVDNLEVDIDTSTIIFNIPEDIVNPGTYTIDIGDDYSTSISVVRSYINSYSPAYKVYGYTDGSFGINGNATVTFDESNLPSVEFRQSGTTIETISSGITTSANALNFEIPEGLSTGIYSVRLVWETGETINLTGNFEVKREINALALTYNSVDAGQSITTYLNGETFALKAIGTKAQESGTVDRTESAEWISSDEDVVTVSGGLVTSVGAGTAQISATWDGRTDSVNVIVNGPANITVSTDDSSDMSLCSEIQLTAVATYADLSEEDVTSLVTWTSSDTNKAQVSQSGNVTAIGSGSAVITASFVSNDVTKSDTKSVSISNLTLSPSSINTAALNSSSEITVSGMDTSLGVVGIEVTVDEVSKTPTIEAISGNNEAFTFKPGVLQAGTYTVSISKGGRIYTKTLTVAQSSITPSLSMLSEGYQAFDLVISGANITFDNAERKPIVSVDGSVIDAASVSVNESQNRISFPFPTGKENGTHEVLLQWVSGRYEGYSLETIINVTDAEIDYVKIYMNTAEVTGDIEMGINDTVELALAAFDASDNSLGYITSLAQWESNSTSVVIVDGGTITAQSVGSASITASYQDKSDSVAVVVAEEDDDNDSGNGGGFSGGSSGGDDSSSITPTASPTASPTATFQTPVPDIEKNITTVNAEKITEEISKITDTQQKVIKFDISIGDKTTKELQLEEGAINSIIAQNVAIEVKSGNVGIEIPVEVLKVLSDSKVKIDVVQIVEAQELAALKEIPQLPNKKLNVLGDIVDLKIISIKGSDEKEISSFDGKVKIEIGVTSDITSMNTKKLGIYYFNEANKSWEYVGGKYNSATQKVEADTRHFTKFTVIEYNRTFSDVKPSSWAKEYIELMAARHITDGVDENNFEPTGDITRAQFATFLVKALGIETSAYTGKFKDIPDGKWYSLHVEAAERAGLVSGLGGGSFAPDANITREQMAVMVMNACKYAKGTDIAEEAKKVKVKFMDEDTLNSWGKDAVYAAKANGIIDGMPGNIYSPKEKATREQSARVIIGLLELLGEI